MVCWLFNPYNLNAWIFWSVLLLLLFWYMGMNMLLALLLIGLAWLFLGGTPA